MWLKVFLVSILVNVYLICLANIKDFPYVAYSSVKFYYFNTESHNTKDRPTAHIYTAIQGFAPNHFPTDITISNTTIKKLANLFKKDLDGLLLGLSNCFIPHHGMVFFNSNNTPVASLSICFECDAIKIWTISSGELKPKVSKANSAKVISKLHLIKHLLTDEGIKLAKPYF